MRVVEHDVVLRQPVELRVRPDAHADRCRAVRPFDLYHLVAPGVVSTACVSSASATSISSTIAARDAAGRMHDHHMADRIAFRIERPLHAQRTFVQAMGRVDAGRACACTRGALSGRPSSSRARHECSVGARDGMRVIRARHAARMHAAPAARRDRVVRMPTHPRTRRRLRRPRARFRRGSSPSSGRRSLSRSRSTARRAARSAPFLRRAAAASVPMS